MGDLEAILEPILKAIYYILMVFGIICWTLIIYEHYEQPDCAVDTQSVQLD